MNPDFELNMFYFLLVINSVLVFLIISELSIRAWYWVRARCGL